MHAPSGPAQKLFSVLERSASDEGKDCSASSILVLACLWLVFLIYPLVELLQEAPPLAELALALAGTLVFFSLYFWTLWRIALKGMARPPWGTLILMGALSLTLPLLLGAAWRGFFVYTGLLTGFTLRLRAMIAAVMVMVGLTVLIAAVTQAPWWQTVALTTVTILGSAMASAIRHFREMNQQLRAAHRQIAALAASEERLRLARELHDSVNQQVFVTSMEIGAARALLDQDREGARTHLQEAESAIRRLHQDLKALVQALRPTPLEGQSLVQAIQVHCSAWAQRTKIAATVSLYGEQTIPYTIEQELFRVVQEALTNIEKHSAASQVTITLSWNKEYLEVRIEDNGRGFLSEEARGRGYGLSHMRERVAMLSGKLHITSGPGSGTTITCICPLPPSGRGTEDE
jgi:signal transduction histidine kinase